MSYSSRFVSLQLLQYILMCIIFLMPRIQSHTTSMINYEYFSPTSDYRNRSEDMRTNGIVSTRGSQSLVRQRSTFVLRDINGNYDACQTPINVGNYSNSIAIIQRGGNCTFSVKITRAKQYGASGTNRLPDRSHCLTEEFSSF
jgi:hypothetical protein